MHLQDHIDEVMDWFDFSRVAKVMECLDWRWPLRAEGTPREPLIRSYVRNAMKEAYVRGCYVSGGFDISYDKESDYFSIQFIAAGWETNMEGK